MVTSLNVKTPDGTALTVSVPDGTDPSQYGSFAASAISHYSSTVAKPSDQSEGPVGSFLRTMGNNLPLGPQFSALVSPGKYSDNMAAINAATAKDQAAHPIVSGAGSVAGAVAPALIPGVGEAMAANPAIAGAALGGTNAISNTDVTKDPIGAAKQAAMGAGTGALVSGLISKMLPAATTVESKANTLANRSVNMPSGVLADMTEAERQAQGQALRQGGVVVKDKLQALTNAQGLLKDYGSKIGEIADTANGQGLVADADQHYQSMSDLLQKAQEFEGSANRVSKAIGRDYKAGATDIANLGDNPAWSDIQSLKEKYGKFAFKENATQGAKDTYFALSNMLKGIADKAQADPGLGPQYKEALSGYSQMTPVVDGLKGAVDSELRGSGAGIGVRGLAGLIRKLPGPVRAVAGPIAVAMGHPIIGLAAALPEIMNPALQSQALGGVAKALPAIQNLGTAAASNAATSPQVADLIAQLQKKFADRNKF